MTARTPEEARETRCPFARTFIRAGTVTLSDAGCIGPDCAIWRWVPIPAETMKAAIQTYIEAEKAKGRKLVHKEATAWVMAHREELGIPTKPSIGYCGAGGQP